MMRRMAAAGILTGLFVLVPTLTSAQVRPPQAGQRQRLEMERRLQAGFGRMVQTRLGLGREAVQGLQGVMASFQEERRTLNQSQAALRYRLRDPNLAEMGEEDARALLQEMVALQQRELELYKLEQEKLLEVLTPVQLVQFYRLRDDLGQQVQRLRQGRGGGGQNRGGGVGSPGWIPSPPGGPEPGHDFFR